MRNGKKRKELYLSPSEVTFIKEAQKICGLDDTNTIRMLMNIGWSTLSKNLHTVASNPQMFVNQSLKKNATGDLNFIQKEMH